MDYLPIQASAVPCERVFSSAGETDTKKRNRISPELMEALQMLKFSYKKERLNFTAGWTTSIRDMTRDKQPEQLLAEVAKGQDDAADSLLGEWGKDDSDDNEDPGN